MASECLSPPYEGNEAVWESRPREPGIASRNPEHIRKGATSALKAGRIHPDRWAEVDDMLLDGAIDAALGFLAEHVKPEPVYPTVPGPRGSDHA